MGLFDIFSSDEQRRAKRLRERQEANREIAREVMTTEIITHVCSEMFRRNRR